MAENTDLAGHDVAYHATAEQLLPLLGQMAQEALKLRGFFKCPELRILAFIQKEAPLTVNSSPLFLAQAQNRLELVMTCVGNIATELSFVTIDEEAHFDVSEILENLETLRTQIERLIQSEN